MGGKKRPNTKPFYNGLFKREDNPDWKKIHKREESI
jgi:hypothetical protein